MKQLHVLDHPLVSLHLSRLRDQNSTPAAFRDAARKLTNLLAVSATRRLSTRSIDVATPVAETLGAVLDETVSLVPVLRAGLVMVDPILDLLPEAEVWHFGVIRDEETAEPTSYYCKIPADHPTDFALVLDPMLATGGTIRLVIRRLREWGVARISVISLLAAPEGVAELSKEFPDVELHVCAVDNNLNAQKFIIPGLGDAGDRSFNTLR
jgi:uracil phosphoribosyltransferase